MNSQQVLLVRNTSAEVIFLDSLRLASYAPTNRDASIPHMRDSDWKISLEESPTSTLAAEDFEGEKCSRSTDEDDEFVCLNPY